MMSFPPLYFCTLVAATGLAGLIAGQADAEQAASPLLQLEVKIPLGDVEGRIDHLAIDLSRKRLFIAELGKGAAGIVDLEGRQVVHTIGGLKEPQGVAYVPSTDTLFVTNAGDGALLLFRSSDYEPAGRVDLGADADNIRVDAAANRIFIGHGDGALATVDLATNAKIADIPLQAHPESFQLGHSTRHIFVNVPKAREIAVIDRFAGEQTASWPVQNGSNFPMALDEKSERVLVSFRNPAQLGVFSMRDGSIIAAIDACGDADDLFVDEKRQRVYLSCGDGYGCVRASRQFISSGGTHPDDFGRADITVCSRDRPPFRRRPRKSRRTGGHMGLPSDTLRPAVTEL